MTPAAADKAAILNADLRRMGCPYSCIDPRCRPWMEGYQAGLSEGEQTARECFAKVLSK